MSVTEHTLVDGLFLALKPRLRPVNVLFKHTDALTRGIPDISLTRNGMTSWWEAKLARPYIHHDSGLQFMTCRRLAASGVCWYIVYQELRIGEIRTCIVDPAEIDDKGLFTSPAERIFHGYAHEKVVDFMLEQHGGGW